MSNYVIKCKGRYVADRHPNATRGSSYTPDIRHAKKYPSREAAQGAACDNETVTIVDAEMGRPW